MEFTPLDDNLKASVSAELRAWNDSSSSAEFPLLGLLAVQNKLSDKNTTNPALWREAINQLLTDCINQLGQNHAELASLLKMRFQQKDTLQETKQNLKLQTVNKAKHMQTRAVDALTGIVAAQETEARQANAIAALADVPPPNYIELVNPERNDALYAQLKSTNTHLWVVVGIGGIGKTSIAHDMSIRFADAGRFSRIIWLRIDQQEANIDRDTFIRRLATKVVGEACANQPTDKQLPMLRQVLDAEDALVVIDNLESAFEIELIVNTVRSLATRSCMLITSRAHPAEQTGVFVYAVKTLPKLAAYKLMRNYGAEVGLAEFVQATDDQLEPIYDKTGGNPLALKLVGGLATVLPLDMILDDLTVAKTDSIGDFYKFVYWRSWQTLEEDEKLLLEMIPLADEQTGMSMQQMQPVTGLETELLWAAIYGLVKRSLLEVSGTTWDRTYTIHRLTYSFLQTEIIGLTDG